MSLWSRLLGMFREEKRFSVAEWARLFNQYPVSTSSPWRDVEEVENNFTSYVTNGYKANGVVFATVLARLLLFTEARFQWQRIENGRPTELFGTPDLSVLERPFPNGTTGELLARMEQDVSLAGNFYAVREGSRLRRLRPDWVEIVLTAPPAEAVQSDVMGYRFHPGGMGKGQPEPFSVEEVCHWSPIPDPDAQYRGMSWLTPVIREVQADEAATEHKLKFFHNGAKPGLVVSFKDLTEEQFGKFKKTMDSTHQGTENAYKTLYLGGGADVTVAGADLKQLDFKNTQGAGETRITAAGGVPAVIVGLSEGLQAATYSNYGQARRKFGDHWARPQWRSACAALETVMRLPRGTEPGTVRLWYDDRDVAFLREDKKDSAEIFAIQASAIRQLVDAGFEEDAAVDATVSEDATLLKGRHTGLFSVQLQPPGAQTPTTSESEEPA